MQGIIPLRLCAPLTGVILFAHGSKDPQWHRPMEAVAHQIQQTSEQLRVLCAYLEWSTPNLSTATSMLLDLGIKDITIVPMFLGMGRHIREDLPALIHTLRQEHPHATFLLESAIGEHPRVIKLLAEIAIENLHAPASLKE